MKSAKRILVLGGAGTLGHKIWQAVYKRFPDSWVTIRKPKGSYNTCGLFGMPNVIDGLDLKEIAQLEQVLNQIEPDVVINCAGVTPRSSEGRDKFANIAVNAMVPHVLARWCTRNGARLIHFSTVCVFDGRLGNYREDSPPDATDLYGTTKSLGEVQAPVALVIRSSFIGREISGGTELLEWFLSQKSGIVKGFKNALFTGLTTNRLAELVCLLIEKHPRLNGLYHVSSEMVSKYELLCLMKDAYNIDIQIEPEETFVCRRHLNGKKFFEATGWDCGSWHEMMKQMARDRTPYDMWEKA